MKRQAMSELQKAVSDAERKAHEMISAERSKMERALAEAKRQASEDALTVINQQEDSSEVSTTDPPPTFPPLVPLLTLLFNSSLPLRHSSAPSFTLILGVIRCCVIHMQLAALGLVLHHVVIITAEADQLSV